MALITFVIAAVVASSLVQQNVSASELAANKASSSVIRKTVTPQWIGTGDRFWYQREREPNKFEFVLVDAKAATRQIFPTKDALELQVGVVSSASKLELQERAPRQQRGIESREVWLTFRNHTGQAIELTWVESVAMHQVLVLCERALAMQRSRFLMHLLHVLPLRLLQGA